LAKILSIIPYPFYPPQNGGSLRCFFILREMAREHDVYLFTVQPQADFFGESEPVFPKNVTIISLFNVASYKSIFNRLPGNLGDALNYRYLKKAFRISTNSYFLTAYSPLLKTLKEVNPCIVFYENLEAVTLFAPVVKKQLPAAKQIYDAHNVDSVLWRQMAIAQNNPVLNTYARHALETEKNLSKMVDRVFCCSEDDREKLVQLNGAKLKAWVVPNAVDTFTKPFDQNPHKYLNAEILFCGSMDYYPNEEGLLWFYNHVFPLVRMAIPHIILTLVGTIQIKESYEKLLNDPAVKFEGRVADLKYFYYRASVCIAPLLSGSGTRLKILEAMSFGNPVVSTSIGAEGICTEDGKHLMIADDPDGFARKVIELQDQEIFENIRKDAHLLVQSLYEWKIIGKRLNGLINC
jgi:polysaccharide biosynthesis protein PslH